MLVLVAVADACLLTAPGFAVAETATTKRRDPAIIVARRLSKKLLTRVMIEIFI
jgi:hypothetical protein